jgi:hypothetical protein
MKNQFQSCHLLLLLLLSSESHGFATSTGQTLLKNQKFSITMTSSSAATDDTSTRSTATAPWTAFDTQQEKEARDTLDVWPLDEENAKLLNEVHPRGYVQSTTEPHEVYDLIAIGSGAGGLVSCKLVCVCCQEQARPGHATLRDPYYVSTF